ncbi:MAG: IPTL-CTERM sorting domain-containing protein [Thermoanaerobaculia bacterium]
MTTTWKPESLKTSAPFRRPGRRCRLLAAAAVLWAAASTGPAQGATITVDGTTCASLVDAVEAAETDAPVNGCGPGSGPDVIELTADVTLTAVDNTSANGPNGLPLVTTDVTVDGGGFRIVRDDAAPAFRFFEVPADGRLRLEDVTLENGLVAGADGADGEDGEDKTFEPGETGEAGKPGEPAHGGAVFNLGTLELSGAELRSNQVHGGSGGRGGDGGNGDFDPAGSGGVGGPGGAALGGAVYNEGSLDAADSRFQENVAFGGAAGRGGNGGQALRADNRSGNGGPGGVPEGVARGGAVWSGGSGAVATFRRVVFEGDRADGGAGGEGGDGRGGAGASNADDDGGDAGDGLFGRTGSEAAGGALYVADGDATVTDSAIRAAEVRGGDGGVGGSGGGGGSGGFDGQDGSGGDGAGGGIGGPAHGAAVAGPALIERTEVSGCLTAGGAGGRGGDGGSTRDGNTGASGNGGPGGDVTGSVAAVGGTTTRVVNSTISGNGATAGNAGDAGSAGGSDTVIGVAFGANGDGGDGGDALGGGSGSADGTAVEIAHTTVAFNQVTAGDGGLGGTTEGFSAGDGDDGDPGTANGAGVHGEASLFSSVLSDNDGADQCAGTLTSLDFNLSSDASCNLTGSSDQPSETGAALESLADNGGPALPGGDAPRTHALGPGSAAEDRGDCGSPPVTTDQRGTARPQKAACDAGAYEVSEAGLDRDFGDAPDPVDGTAGEYPTLLAGGGARHGLSADLFLGACADAETDGQPAAAADGDDVAAGTPVVGTCAEGGDDEDGVSVGPLVAGAPAEASVTVVNTTGEDAHLALWIDWNQDGVWADPGERVVDEAAVPAGASIHSFPVPAGALPGATFARARLSTDAIAGPGGFLADGEVEDHPVTVLGADTFRADVVGTKEVTGGDLAPGGTAVYTVVLTNLGPGLQQDNPGDEFVDVLPAELELLSASADSGAANADPGTDTVTWNGEIPAGGTVAITIEATIPEDTPLDTAIANQGTVHYDADGLSSNDATRPTDDPETVDPEDPTVFLVLPASVLEIPTLGEWGLWLLALLLAAGGAVTLRK